MKSRWYFSPFIIIFLTYFVVLTSVTAQADTLRPKIMLTGYWPPSNEAIRRFSQNPAQNPSGWIGENWEGRGYDIVSFFPEFNPPNCQNCGVGGGDLTVDYQDTSTDFWNIVNQVAPIAIITFSRGFPNISWELEMNQYNRSEWVDDYIVPLQPIPSPPDSSVPAETLRNSTLPVEAIVADLQQTGLNIAPYVCYTEDGGGFLSEFIGYHGVWYQSLHNSISDLKPCLAAGHVHVGALIPWGTARKAAQQTIRTLIEHLDSFGPLPVFSDLTGDSIINAADLGVLLGNWGSCSNRKNCVADLNSDEIVDGLDLTLLLGVWS